MRNGDDFGPATIKLTLPPKSLGWTMPPTLLAIADEVIE
jgi:hypothetical protein